MTYVYIGIAAAVVVAIAYLGIKAALRTAKEQGAAEERADASEDARKTEQEMTDIVLRPTSPTETKDKLKKGEF